MFFIKLNRDNLLNPWLITIFLSAVLLFSHGFNCQDYSLTDTNTGSSGGKKPIPDAPANLVATTISQTQINLSWTDNSKTERGFKIERKTLTTEYSLLTTVGQNITSYSDTDLTEDTTYYYRVCAYNNSGDSSYSNETSAIILISLNAPSALTATAISSNQIDLSWTDNSNNEDGFKIERKVSVGGTYEQIATTATDVIMYSDTTITPGNTYYYRVRAYNVSGNSAYSPEANATIQSLTNGDWVMVSVGGAHTVALASNKTIWSWGWNYDGQLGLGDTSDRCIPFQIESETDWSKIAVGCYHTLAIKINRTLWIWGNNSYGQLGLGDTTNRLTPTQVGTFNDWDFIDGGVGYTVGTKTNGTIWAWGCNEFGQLGLGDTLNRNIPTQMGTESNWSKITAGAYGFGWNGHTLALKNNGTLWACGKNSFGQLGVGDAINRNTITQIGTQSDWYMIASGGEHSIGFKTNNTLWSWGCNGSGQLGLGDTVSRITPVQVGTSADWIDIVNGSFYSIAMKADHTMWAWGKNQNGQLGLGDSTTKGIPYQVGTNIDWLIITAGNSHNMAIKTTGTLWSWGSNSYGQLGLGDTIDRWTPTQIGSGGTINPPYAPSVLTATAISSTRISLTWTNVADETGYKIERSPVTNTNYAQIATTATDIISYNDTTVTPSNIYYYRVRAYNAAGDGGYSPDANATTPLASTGDWSIIAAGTSHSVALKTNMTFWVWGGNLNGQLGLGNTIDSHTPTQVGTASDWVQIAAGGMHTLSRKTTGRLWVWGSNNRGQLGLGDTINRNTPTSVGTESDWIEVAAGGEHSLGRKTTGRLWVWGSNNRGQLGLGDTTNRFTPTSIGTATDWTKIIASCEYTLGIKTNKTIWGWGDNSYGQLGLGDTLNRYTPTSIGTLSDWVQLTAGEKHTLGLKITHTLWGWGYNSYGQLGLGVSGSRITPTQVGNDSDWSTVTAGSDYTLGLKTNGALWAWGGNNYGQLGLGDSGTGTNRYVPTQIEADLSWTKITAGNKHTLGLKTNGNLWVWGYNQNGELGLGDTLGRSAPTLVGE